MSRSFERGTGSFEDFVSASWPRLVRSAILLGLDPSSAEDAAQIALARSHVAWDKVSNARDPDAYVHKILINGVNHSRRRKWWGETPQHPLPELPSRDPTDDLPRNEALLAAVRELPRPQREVVVLRYYSDFTEAQTAEVLNVAVGTVKSRASRALAALARHTDLVKEQEYR